MRVETVINTVFMGT